MVLPELAPRPLATHDAHQGPTAHLWLVVGLTVLAAALRLHQLGTWSFDGDEIFTLRDSLVTRWPAGPKALLFFLNYHLIRPWHALDELGLRLLPAVFGIAAIPTMYVMTATMLGRRAGLVAALLLTLHPWHVYWSQFARYYSLVFLATTVFPVALLFAIRDRRAGWAVAGAVAFVAGVLAHPSAALPVAGIAAWALLTERRRLPRRWALVAALGAVAVLVPIAWHLSRIWRTWYGMGHNWGHQGAALLLSYVDGLSLTLVLLALGGVAWLWSAGHRRLAYALIATVAVPAVFLVAASYIVSVSNSYLLATAPVAFMAAAWFIARLAEPGMAAGHGRLVSATCLAVALAAGAPRLVSHYRDGSRPDLRAGAGYIAEHAAPGDAIVADQSQLVRYYLPGRAVGSLRRDAAALGQVMAGLRDTMPAGTLWIVTTRRWRGGFNDLDLGAAAPWIAAHCGLKLARGAPRIDYKHDEVQVYRCAAAEAGA